LLVRLGKDMELKGLRAVWRGRDIGLLGGLEGCIIFVFLVCSTDTGLCDTPHCCFVAFVFSLRCSHVMSRYQFVSSLNRFT
jgi:hypothetical protein